jgi:predicted phage-related endonuclease
VSVDELDAFRERRRNRVGASDVAAAQTGAFGQSPASIITEKLGQIVPHPETPAMRRGLELEDRVIDASAALLDVEVEGRQLEIAHPRIAGFVATLDAVVVSRSGLRGPLEVKTTNGQYPKDYLAVQLHAQMACLHVLKGISAIWDPSTGILEVQEWLRDWRITEAVETMAADLVGYLERREVPPPAFASDSSLWNRLHPQSTSGMVDLDTDLIDELRQCDKEARAAKDRLEVIQARVKEQLGKCSIGTVDSVPVVRWPTITERRVDFTALSADHGELLDEYRKVNTIRRFTLISAPKTTSRQSKH